MLYGGLSVLSVHHTLRAVERIVGLPFGTLTRVASSNNVKHHGKGRFGSRHPQSKVAFQTAGQNVTDSGSRLRHIQHMTSPSSKTTYSQFHSDAALCQTTSSFVQCCANDDCTNRNVPKRKLERGFGLLLERSSQFGRHVDSADDD